MKKTLKLIPVVFGTMALVACQAENPPLTGTPPPAEKAIVRTTSQDQRDALTVAIDNRIDILFVIDDSKSMKHHTEKLSQGISKFVGGIASISNIDFHIAYTTVNDSQRYGSVVARECGGRLNWENSGTLKKLNAPEGVNLPDRRYVTREDNFQAILEYSLNPNKNKDLIKDFVESATPEDSCPRGPQFEESFSPLLSAIEVPLVENKGFRRAGAFFVAIIVSDAKDESRDATTGQKITPEQVAERLARVTGQLSSGNKKFRVFAVAMKPGSKVSASCKPDPAFNQRLENGKTIQRTSPIGEDENPLANLARLTEDDSNDHIDQVLSICSSDFGTKLAEYGTRIKEDALPDIVVPLRGLTQVFEDPSDSRNLAVYIGEQRLDESLWQYNYQKGIVTIFSQNIPWEKIPKGAKVRVERVYANPLAPTTKQLGK